MGRTRWLAIVAVACAVFFLAVRSESSSGAPVFSSARMLRVRIEAPVKWLFPTTAQSQNNGNAPEKTVAGTLSYIDDSNQSVVLPNVRFSLRGHTSLDPTECTFPKLSAAFEPGAALDRSIFRGLKTIKIGTHCGDSADGERTPKGRLANDKAPLREAFVYRLLDTLGVATLQARPAEITYVDGQETTRHAMLLEDVDTAAARLGAGDEIDKSKFSNAHEMFEPDAAVKLAFGEALIGNFDWCVKWTPDDTYRCDAREILWNVIALRGRGGRAIPLAYDFDVAGMVNGTHGWFPRVYDESFAPSGSRAEVEVLGQVQRTRSMFARPQLDRARRELMARKNGAYHAFDEADVDPGGRSTIKAYMDAFFAAIERDDAFYRPAVTAASTPVFADEKGTQRVCAIDVPAGTVVAEADGSAGADAPAGTAATPMAHVKLLDVHWRWAQNRSCDGMRKNPVWIARNAVGTEFPRQ